MRPIEKCFSQCYNSKGFSDFVFLSNIHIHCFILVYFYFLNRFLFLKHHIAAFCYEEIQTFIHFVITFA